MSLDPDLVEIVARYAKAHGIPDEVNDQQAIRAMLDLESAQVTLCSFNGRLPHVTGEDPVITMEDYHRVEEVQTILSYLRASMSGISGTINAMQEKVVSQEATLTNLRREVSSTTRAQTDTQRELKALKRASIPLAVEQLTVMSGLDERILDFKGVAACEIVPGHSGMVIDIVTHPFVMKLKYYDDDGDDDDDAYEMNDQVLLGPWHLSINTGALSYDARSSIKFYMDDAENGYHHPHVDIASTSRICWGTAGIPIADAWGRRDWESLIRIILTWATRYNHDSPYVQAYQLLDAYGSASHLNAGWRLPAERQQPEQIAEEVTAVAPEPELVASPDFY